MKRLEVTHFGPIRDADVSFDDLTVLVGKQATGKSLFAQLVKAIADAGAIRNDLKSYGYDWLHGKDLVADYSSLYFGGGLEKLLARVSIRYNGRVVSAGSIAKPGGNSRPEETVFLVPAQRVLVLQDGWPKPFMAYLGGDPYSMRRFSEVLRSVMDGFEPHTPVFPQSKRLMSTLRTAIDRSIYAGFELKLELQGNRKQLVLTAPESKSGLPINAWSAGQREFTPLLFSMYWLMPSASSARRGDLEHVIIEEPEMGLHPMAIVGFMLVVLALLQRGYRVTLSTHSSVVLDVVWALSRLKSLRQRSAVGALRKIFEVSPGDNQINATLQAALKKGTKVYYFERSEQVVRVHDISDLDPSAEDEAEAGWGGLSGFSGRIAEIVGQAMAES